MANTDGSFDSYDASKLYSQDDGEEESFLSINEIDEQYLKKNIKDEEQDLSKVSHIFVPPEASQEELKALKTILFCCNTNFFLNKENIDYDNSDDLSTVATKAKADIHKQLISGALSLKKLAQQKGTEKVSEPQYYRCNIEFESNIGSKTIVSEIQFKDDNHDYYVQIDKNGYIKKCKKHRSSESTAHGRQLSQDNQLTIMHGEFTSNVHAKGTYIIISKNLIKNPTANEIIIDICYNYENNDAPNKQVGGGSVFRITLTQQKDKYTLKEIKKGNMIEDKVDENSLSETNKNAIQEVIDNEVTGRSLRETLAEEPELCNVLQEAQVISQERYQSMIDHPIKEEINGKWYIISKKLLAAELSQSQGERMQDDNYNNSQNNPNTEQLQQNNPNTEQLQSSKRQSNSNNISQQLPNSKDRDNSERPPDINVNTEDVKHNYNFLCLKDTWIGKDKTTGKYGCCGFNCC